MKDIRTKLRDQLVIYVNNQYLPPPNQLNRQLYNQLYTQFESQLDLLVRLRTRNVLLNSKF